jgi:hypothetical protein
MKSDSKKLLIRGSLVRVQEEEQKKQRIAAFFMQRRFGDSTFKNPCFLFVIQTEITSIIELAYLNSVKNCIFSPTN